MWFAQSLQKQGFKFCFRLSSTWKEAYNLLSEKDDLIWSLPKGKRYRTETKEMYLKEEIQGFRLVKIVLANGQEVVLFTNLSAQEKFPKELLKELYKLRWTIEECYKKLKQVVHIEYFSGRTSIAIEQDFYSRIILLNISAMIETQELQPDDINCKKQYKHPKQINRTQVLLKLKEFLYDLLSSDHLSEKLSKMIYL